MAPSLLGERGVAPRSGLLPVFPLGEGDHVCALQPLISQRCRVCIGEQPVAGGPHLCFTEAHGPQALNPPREGTAGWVSLTALLGHGGLFPLSSDATSRGCVLSAAPSHGLAGAELEMLPQLGSPPRNQPSGMFPLGAQPQVVRVLSGPRPGWAHGEGGGSWAGWFTPAGHQSGHSLWDKSPSLREGNPFPR